MTAADLQRIIKLIGGLALVGLVVVVFGDVFDHIKKVVAIK